MPSPKSEQSQALLSSAAQRMQAWSWPVARARFVNDERAALLSRLGLTSIADLLYHKPLRYLDLRHTASLATVPLGEATVAAEVYEVKERYVRPKFMVTEVTLFDGTGVLLGVWFNQKWVKRAFKVGETVAFAGTVKLEYGFKRIVQPFYEKLNDENAPAHVGRILPVHSTTEGLSVGWMRRIIAAALDDFADVPEYLPPAITTRRNIPLLPTALRNLHFPPTPEAAEAARRRLAYGEFFDFSLLMERRHEQRTHAAQAFSHVIQGPLLKRFMHELIFTLTPDQEQATREILADMARPEIMQRMLLGDVGTGKTLVAAFALIAAVDSGVQATMMAPTEVLAQQYAEKLGPQLDALGIRWVLLTGSTPRSAREAILNDLASGATSIIFGTHALLEDVVHFADLRLVIIDEQHRFGVNQRAKLSEKSEGADLLVMSATPIPRTLALVAYGDLTTSYLRTRPVPGAGVRTHLINSTGLSDAYAAIRAAVAAGHQAYVICALVEDSDAIDARSVAAESEHLKNEEFAGFEVGVLTGKLASDEKEAIMQRFRSGEIQVLVATTVIEVGVDIPNATVMVILDADRFGLAQLHQLRGRVGRGSVAGDVWLVARGKGKEAHERLQALLDTDDGFALAELDLRQRGAGELLGARQSGMAQFAVGDLVADSELVRAARQDSEELLAYDADFGQEPQALLALRIASLEEKRYNWGKAG